MTRETATKFPVGYFKLLAYAAMIGAVSALLTAGYLTALNGGIKFFEQPKLVVLNLNIWPLILLTVGGLILGLTIKFFGQHAGLGVAQLQYAQTGRVEPKYVPRIMLQAFITLWSGAAVGPEGPLTFLSGGVGSFIADRLRLEKEDVPVLVYSAIAGAFGSFFGSPLIGAFGAFEFMFIKALDFYRHLIPGIIAAIVGYGVYSLILHTSFLGIFTFPNYGSPHFVDYVWALLVGVIAGVIGIMFKLIFGVVHHIFSRLSKRPVMLAVIGGVVIGLIGSFLPLTLYSGQDQLIQIIHNPAAYGVGVLILLLLVKALLTSTSFATGFDGGPIFPTIFIGGTLGLAMSKILVFIPEGVAVTAAMAGVCSAFIPIPITMILLLGLLGGKIDLLPTIAIGAITGFVVSKALTPLLPKPPNPKSNGKSP